VGRGEKEKGRRRVEVKQTSLIASETRGGWENAVFVQQRHMILRRMQSEKKR